ncbi:hypothetical protein TWF694_008617 [Orbilia ellipsospora]|uniref:Uncharacterized protein n=1 Tax=Orbilia ellipsospora TaxID=2528407 RepID=A0AAV9XI67_9PEZI
MARTVSDSSYDGKLVEVIVASEDCRMSESALEIGGRLEGPVRTRKNLVWIVMYCNVSWVMHKQVVRSIEINICAAAADDEDDDKDPIEGKRRFENRISTWSIIR